MIRRIPYIYLSRYSPITFLVVLFLLSGFAASGQLTSEFRYSDSAGCAPLVIRFVNSSKNATSYHWDLGNGITSTAKDVSATYVTAGTYSVTLTASDGVTSKDSTLVIRAYGKPTVNFNSTDTSVCPMAPVNFTNSTVSNAWGSVSYVWNFGDGISLVSVNPTHYFVTPGRYSITLFAMNSKGCVNTNTKGGFVNIQPQPGVFFKMSDNYLCKPGSILFTDSVTGKLPLVKTWHFGDGTTSYATKPAHGYSVPGWYDIQLTVKDANGCADSVILPSAIGVSGFNASFTPVTTACIKREVRFVNTSSKYTTSKWDYGDGFIGFSDTGSHVYIAPGTYNVKLIVYNDTCYDSVVHPVTIVNNTGSFTASQLCTPASTVSFNATVPAGTTVKWDFSDGVATGNSVIHNFSNTIKPPIYPVYMIYTNGFGCVDSASIADTMKNPFIVLTLSDSVIGCAPLHTHFHVLTFYKIKHPHPPCPDPGCDELVFPYPYALSSYVWDFGDGSPTATGSNPIHIYTATGKYIAHCHAVTVNGCAVDTTFEIKVGKTLNPSFTMSPTHLCAGQPMVLTSTSPDNSLADNYTWDLGEGALKDSQSPIYIHRSEEPGIHDVKLVMWNNGCKSTPTAPQKDTIDGPNARFLNTYTCIPRNGMTYTKYTIGDTSHLWQFGDGTTSTLDNPTHYYPGLNTYVATLTTYNPTTGCRDTGSITIELQRMAIVVHPYLSALCRDVVDTISLQIYRTDTTNPYKLRWYNNGILTDTHLPDPPPPLARDWRDTIYHPMVVKGDNSIVVICQDNHNCYDTAYAHVLVAKPTDTFDFTPPATCPSTAIYFTDRSTDVAGVSVVSYAWSFGDGTSSTLTTPFTTHTYTASASYTIKEIVTDNLGCSDTLVSASKPTVHRPKAGFLASSTYTCEKVTISFNNTSTGSSSWLWSFGDGTTSTLALPVHTYTTPGSYTVRLIANDIYGCSDTASEPNYVIVNPNPKASFHVDDSFAVCPPLTVNFINTSTGATFDFWSLGDGSYSTDVYPSNIYVSPGQYHINLKVSNPYGCIDTASADVRVFGYTGAFTYTPLNVCLSSPVHFKGIFSKIIDMVWDFGDGVISNPSISDTISHIYANPGSYMPKLVLTGVSGCSNFSYGADTIRVDTITAGFKINPNPVCQYSNVTFTDTSAAMFLPPNTWTWSFGAGGTSTLRSPVFAYSVAGTFPITLTAANAAGCSGSFTKNITINPGPDTIIGNKNLCLGTTVLFSDATSGGVWSSSNTGAVRIDPVTGSATTYALGTSRIEYSLLSTGCKASMTVRVNDVPKPITGKTDVCAGSSSKLNDATSSGIWSSSNTSVATIDATTGMTSGIKPGTSTISYTLSSGCSATQRFTVDTTPVSPTGVSTVCAGMAITLTNAVSGGSWSTSNTATIFIGPVTGTLTGLAAGTASVTYALSTGCSALQTVSVHPVPLTITGKNSICATDTSTYKNLTPSGIWSCSNTTVGTISSGFFTAISAGTVTLTYSLPTGCNTTKTVSVNPLPGAITGSSQMCVGTGTSLSNASTGGTWSTSSTILSIGSTSGIVSGSAAGTATVSYTLTTGCLVAKQLTVNPLPSAIAGAKNLCLGNISTLSDAIPGGLWSSPDATVSVAGGSGVITGTATGTATITYALSTGCYATVQVTINPVPPSITGIPKVCAGSSVLLSNSFGGGSWSSSAPSIATIDASGKLTGIAGGSATITYMSAVGCSVSITATVVPVVAAITGPAEVCEGTNISLSDFTPGGTWSSSNISIATVDPSGNVKALHTGTVTIFYTSAAACGTASAAIAVKPLPNAGKITGPTRVCAGASILLSDSIVGGSWSSGNLSLADVDVNGQVTAIAAGAAGITYTYTNSCGTAKTQTIIIIDPTPETMRINTHPDTTLCSQTYFRNFGVSEPEKAGMHYVWSASNAEIYATGAGKQYCLVSFHNEGDGIVRFVAMQSSTGCGSGDSIVFHVSHDQVDMPGISYYSPEFVCLDNTADSYQWGYDDASTLDSAILEGMVNQSYYNANPDFGSKYYWVLTSKHNCLQKSYYNTPTALRNTTYDNNIEIHLYPNPADEVVNIEVTGLTVAGLTEVKVFDMLGREKKTSIIKAAKGKITVSDLVPGTYMVALSNSGKRIGSGIFVKE